MNENTENRVGVLKIVDTRTKLLALTCLIIEAGLIATLPLLGADERLYAFLASTLFLSIMIAGIFLIERTKILSERIVKHDSPDKTSLEDVVMRFFQGAKEGSSFRGYLINSGRFLERYAGHEIKQGLKLGDVRLLMPSKKAIELAFKDKNEPKKAYLIETISAYKRQWEELRDKGYISRIDIRYIDAFPNSLYVIRDGDLFVRGLYEHDSTHVIGFTCTISWLGINEDDVKSYIDWFDSIWNESETVADAS